MTSTRPRRLLAGLVATAAIVAAFSSGQAAQAAPTPPAALTAIAWLRLKAAPATPGPDGDRLVGTTYIQRIATTGGLTPAAADCNATTAGAAREVPYTADYLFWKARTS